MKFFDLQVLRRARRRRDRDPGRECGRASVTAVYPRSDSNYDAGRLRALGLSATALLRTGPTNADDCIASARASLQRSHSAATRFLEADRGYTETRHLATLGDDPPETATRLARARIYVSATQAPGNDQARRRAPSRTQELVPRSLRARDMNHVADVITRVRVDHENPEVARNTVEAIRAGLARDTVAR